MINGLQSSHTQSLLRFFLLLTLLHATDTIERSLVSHPSSAPDPAFRRSILYIIIILLWKTDEKVSRLAPLTLSPAFPFSPATRIHNTSSKYEKSLRLYVAKPTIKSQSVYSVVHWDWNRRRRRRWRSGERRRRTRETFWGTIKHFW